MSTAENAMERLSERIVTLDGLFQRGIVTGPLLRKQLKSILSSRDAGTVFIEHIEPDKKAIKILNRIENPSGWRELFAKNRDEREIYFYETLQTILSSDNPQEERILRMLQLACLPFYSGFLPLSNDKKKVASEMKPSRVSVLD